MKLNLTRRQKSVILISMDSIFIVISSFLARELVQAYTFPSDQFYFVMVGVCVSGYLILGLRYHLFSKIIRYTSVYEISKSTMLMTVSFAISGLITLLFIKTVSFRYIFLMYVFSLVLIPGSRVVWRFYHEWQRGDISFLKTKSRENRPHPCGRSGCRR